MARIEGITIYTPGDPSVGIEPARVKVTLNPAIELSEEELLDFVGMFMSTCSLLWDTTELYWYAKEVCTP